MKIKIRESQLNLLEKKLILIEGKGFQINEAEPINESIKEYKVRVFFGSYVSEIRVGAYSSASALSIAKLMFPKSIVTGSMKLVG